MEELLIEVKNIPNKYNMVKIATIPDVCNNNCNVSINLDPLREIGAVKHIQYIMFDILSKDTRYGLSLYYQLILYLGYPSTNWEGNNPNIYSVQNPYDRASLIEANSINPVYDSFENIQKSGIINIFYQAQSIKYALIDINSTFPDSQNFDLFYFKIKKADTNNGGNSDRNIIQINQFKNGIGKVIGSIHAGNFTTNEIDSLKSKATAASNSVDPEVKNFGNIQLEFFNSDITDILTNDIDIPSPYDIDNNISQNEMYYVETPVQSLLPRKLANPQQFLNAEFPVFTPDNRSEMGVENIIKGLDSFYNMTDELDEIQHSGFVDKPFGLSTTNFYYNKGNSLPINERYGLNNEQSLLNADFELGFIVTKEEGLSIKEYITSVAGYVPFPGPKIPLSIVDTAPISTAIPGIPILSFKENGWRNTNLLNSKFENFSAVNSNTNKQYLDILQ